jgi:hypothetical protein
VLARQNPFLDDDFSASAPRPATSNGWPADDQFQPETARSAPIVLPVAAPVQAVGGRPAALPVLQPDVAAEADETPAVASKAAGTLDLAGLLSWLQETAAQFNPSDFRMLIQLAAYGGLIDGGLEHSLVELGGSVSENDARKASLPEFALALRKLEAVRAMKSITNGTRRNAA